MKNSRSVMLLSAMLLVAAGEPIMVDVRTGGDDGLTQRLADEVRSAFAHTPGYTGDPSEKQLIVSIPTHVAWRDVGRRTKITYAVELATGRGSIRHTGSCWESNMSVCAGQIVRAASVLKPR